MLKPHRFYELKLPMELVPQRRALWFRSLGSHSKILRWIKKQVMNPLFCILILRPYLFGALLRAGPIQLGLRDFPEPMMAVDVSRVNGQCLEDGRVTQPMNKKALESVD